MKTTTETVTRIFCELLGVSDDAVKPESQIVADLKADSLEVIELCVDVEDEFDLEITDEDFEKCITVADVVALVDRLLPTPACARVG